MDCAPGGSSDRPLAAPTGDCTDPAANAGDLTDGGGFRVCIARRWIGDCTFHGLARGD